MRKKFSHALDRKRLTELEEKMLIDNHCKTIYFCHVNLQKVFFSDSDFLSQTTYCQLIKKSVQDTLLFTENIETKVQSYFHIISIYIC